jgi:single-stranded-DNA-specific exonuclease
VRVGDFVANNLREDPGGIKCFLLRLRDLCYYLEIFSNVRHIPDPAVVRLRYHLGVARRLGMNIEEGEVCIVFIYLVRGDLSLNDFAKNAVLHAAQYNTKIMFRLHDPLSSEARASLTAYDDLTAALLSRRGVASREDAELFLHPSYDLHLHDPLAMTDMPKAAERLARAILSGEKIAAWTDYDCDGTPAAVLLHDFFKKVGANFEIYIPHRHLEGYGVNISGIEKLAERGITLIVTADSGITDVAAIARANELGIDVIVTDHHLPGEKLPDAYAVVNPNARADETYPYRFLCGSAVAWKLVCATLATSPALRERVSEGWEKWLLDMVGLATIADMVPLTGENRLLATYGLKVLRKSPRLGLAKLCRLMRVDQRRMSEDDVGFMLAPRVNAASRMGDARDAFQLFTTEDETRAEELAKKLEKVNRERKAAAGAITRAVRARLREREMKSVIALGDPEWRPSLLGLVANGIAEEYERPVFLWGREGNESLKGSVRSGGGTHILELMRATENTFAEFGGHALAGGFTVRDTEIFYLEERLCEAHERLGDAKEAALEAADAELTPREVTEALLKKLERLAPFGEGNPKVVFLFRNVHIHNISRFGKGNEHIKLKIAGGDHPATIEAVSFFAKRPHLRVLEVLPQNEPVHLLAHIERDTFSRGNPVRLRLIDIVAATV